MTKFAIALYDNEAESDEELSFNKNDILEVKQIDFMGMKGWWLCKLVKENRTGLAPGNRLKLTNDEKIVSKLSTLKSNKSNLIVNNSNSTSSSSITSVTSNSSNNSQSNIETLNSSLDAVSLTDRINLPAKIKTTNTSIFKLNGPNRMPESNYNTLKKSDEDDYDYDIPENNRPISKLIKELEESRKSISPTIDSGISTSSLMSLNSETHENVSRLSSMDQRISNYSNYCDSKYKQDTKYEFDDKVERICHLITNLENFNSNQILINDNLKSLKTLMQEFMTNSLKILKQEHACFHPDLNTFNLFKKCYEYIEIFSSELSLNEDLKYTRNELSMFRKLLKQLKDLVEEKNMFNYHSETTQFSNHEDNDNHYEYDNNNIHEDMYENEGDYCEIDELEEEKCMRINRQNLEKLVEKVSKTSALCMTLKRSDEKIRREIKLATSLSECENSKITMSDQMLLKFYLNHIEENFSDLKIIYEALIEKMSKRSSVEIDLANKLALNGHKLVFICDTLQRNLNNEILKINLYEISNILCSSLKNYMLRIKPFSDQEQKITCQHEILKESLNNVYKSADNFKQIVMKNFYTF